MKQIQLELATADERERLKNDRRTLLAILARIDTSDHDTSFMAKSLKHWIRQMEKLMDLLPPLEDNSNG